MTKKQPFQVRGGKLRTQARDPVTGRRLSITAGDPGEMKLKRSALEETRRDYRYGLLSPSEATRTFGRIAWGVVKLEEVWREYVASAPLRSRRMLASMWGNRIAPFLGDAAVVELNEVRLRTWERALLEKGYSPKSVKNTWERIAVAVKLAVKSKKVPELPFGDYRPPRHQSRMREACRSLEEFVQLVTAAREEDAKAWGKGRYADLTYRVFVAGLSGLRNGEVGGLGWDDVEIDASPSVMHVRHQTVERWRGDHPEWERPLDPPKDGPRTLVIHPSVVEVLRAQREQLRARGWWRVDGPVFPGPDGRWRGHNITIESTALRRLAARVGLPNVNQWCAHSLRHTFATLEVIASGGDLRATQMRTGHSSVRMLENYMHAGGRGLAESKIPALPSHVVPAPGELTAVGVELGADPPAALLAPSSAPLPYASGALVDLAQATQARAVAYQRELDRKKREAADKRAAPEVMALDALAAKLGPSELARLDAEGKVPPEVSKMGDARYRKAYQRATRANEGEIKARAAGMRSKRALLGRWGQAAKKVLQSAPATEATA
jgi:integrase